MKKEKASGRHNNLVTELHSVETEKSYSFRIALLHKQIEVELKELRGENEALLTKLDQAKEWVSVLRVNKSLGTNYRSGEGKKLVAWSRRNGVEVRTAFDSRWGRVNVYHVDTWRAVYGLDVEKE
jgi:hypothetical protein